jgi:serine/threonine protein phosphatase PrpC/CheY-like chemotaxis protein
LDALRDEIQYRSITFSEQCDEELVYLLSRTLERDFLRRITLNEFRNSPWLTGIVIPTGHAEKEEPVPKGDFDDSESDDEPPLPEDGGKTRVLIVEDVALVRKTVVVMFGSILKHPDEVELVTVTDGDEAVQECKRKKYTLVLMDVHMSRLTGVEATQRIRQYEKDRGLPHCNIVGLTADNHKEVAESCLQAGMNTVVAKPLIVSTLREICVTYGIEVKTLKASAWISDASTPHALLYAQGSAPEVEQPEQPPAEKSSPEETNTSKSRDASPEGTNASKSRDASPEETNASKSRDASPESKTEETKNGNVEKNDVRSSDAIKEASKAWMWTNRKKRLIFKFEDVPVGECEPWALGIALRELRENDISLDAQQYAKLHEIVRKASAKDSVQMQRVAPDADSRVSLEYLDIVVKTALAPFLCMVSDQEAWVPDAPIHSHGDQGIRGTMEDLWVVVEHLRSFCGFPVPEGQTDDIFIGLYDGHTGKEAAEFARDHLHYYLANQPTYETDMEASLAKTFFQTDEGFIRSAPGSEAGTTATAIIIRGTKLFISNAGDARVVLCRNQLPVVLTKLHRPEDPEETELIKNRGGSIYFYNGAWRVNATLSVSRSLGDYSCRQYITCEPEVVVHNIDYSQDEFLVVASDGLWDYMSPEEVVAFVQQCRHEVDDARAARLLQQNGLASDSDNEDGTSSESMQNYAIVTAALVDEALQKGSSDNVSCVIVHFQNGLATVSS